GPEDARRRVMHEAVRIIANALGGYYIGDDYKLWIEDKQFIETFKQLSPHNYFSMERKYTLKQYAKSVSTVDGAVAECGSYVGVSAWFIANELRDTPIYLFDSFEGLPEPCGKDL